MPEDLQHLRYVQEQFDILVDDTLLKTSNAPLIIVLISSMTIIWAIWTLQYIKFKAFKGIFLI